MASIVLDDGKSHITTGGGSWSGVLSDRFFGGSAMWPAFAADDHGDTGNYGSLSIEFEGTSVAFVGNTPSPKNSQWVWVSIDGGQEYNSSYMDPTPPSSRQWFQSPILPDAKHTINISRIAGTSVDFVVITAGNSTPLSGKELIVDDGDPSITYQGSWVVNKDSYTSRDAPPIGLPYGNATHLANSTDSSATFKFSGSSAALYGIFTFDVLGTLSVQYTMDGFAINKTYSVNASTPEFTSGVKQLENFLLYSNNSLASGDHTLEFQIMDSVDTAFELDYILYTPSFGTLASKPGNLSPSSQGGQSPSPSSNYASQPAAQTNAETNVQTRSLSTLQLSDPTSTLGASAPGLEANASTSGSSPTPGIVGGVLGGVIFLVLLTCFILLWRRRASKRLASWQPMSAADTPGPLSVHPFVVSASSMSATSGLYGVETGLSPMSPFRPQTKFLTSPAPPPRADPSNFSPLSAREEGANGLSPGQAQRLQELFQDLNREIAAGTLGGPAGIENARIAELRGRIAEVSREVRGTLGDIDVSESLGVGSPVTETASAPPAYEAGTVERLGYLGQAKRYLR